jgi:HIT zinc finger
MSNLASDHGVDVAPPENSMETETAAPVVGGEDSNSNSEVGSSRTPAAQPEDKSKGKVCGVCNDHEARYKCSRCQLP